MSHHYMIITFFDMLTIALLLLVANDLWRTKNSMLKSVGAMLFVITIEILFAAIAIYVGGTSFVIIKSLGRAIEAFGVWRFYRAFSKSKKR